MRCFFSFIISVLLSLTISLGPAHAQNMNKITIGIMAGGVTGTYARFAQDLADTLDSESLRVIPMLGKGSRQNIKDLVQLNGVDIAIVQNDVIDEMRRTGEVEGVEHAIRYISKLYNEEIHVVARKDILSLKSLAGQSVGVGREGSGTEMTASLLLDALGIEVKKVHSGGQEAIDLVRQGALAAAIFVVGKPSRTFVGISADDGVKFLDIFSPKNATFNYFDTVLSHEDYPNLIPEGTAVSTLAVGAVLAVFNWREGTRKFKLVGNFTSSFFDVLPLLQASDKHPKWQEVDPAISVPGWTRFKPAQEWVDGNY